jgi:hypothetical protein
MHIFSFLFLIIICGLCAITLLLLLLQGACSLLIIWHLKENGHILPLLKGFHFIYYEGSCRMKLTKLSLWHLSYFY